jgi:REP element-mobilizing transposase RayT
MSRQVRLEYPGALFHVTSRGNARQNIFFDDDDRELYLELLGATVKKFGWILTAYVLMSNHVHLLIQLTANTMSLGMKWLNEKYAQRFNRRHDRVGHLFQGRPKAPLIEKDSYFLEVLRYVVLNPFGQTWFHCRRITAGAVIARFWGLKSHRNGSPSTTCSRSSHRIVRSRSLDIAVGSTQASVSSERPGRTWSARSTSAVNSG